MNRTSLAAFLVLLVGGACQPRDVIPSACRDVKEPFACTVPFEVIYSDRDALFGRLISVDGVLGAGIHPEPPGSVRPVFVLFSSWERARVCNPQLSLELLPGSEAVRSKLELYGGDIVAVTGRLRPVEGDAWAQFEVTEEPVPLTMMKGQISCLSDQPRNLIPEVPQ